MKIEHKQNCKIQEDLERKDTKLIESIPLLSEIGLNDKPL